MTTSPGKYIRTVIAALLMLVCCPTTYAQLRRNSMYESYIAQYKDIAIEQMLKHDIPASITLAQGLLESGAGRSTLATKGNNHFGIKCHDWTGKKMHQDDDMRNDCFRVYDSPRESYEDHSSFLHRQRYKSLFTLKRTDYKGWARGLKACGYATNPRYAQKLIEIIELYDLQQYDKAKSYDTFMARHEGGGSGDGHGSHSISYNNDNYYVVARNGDTFRSIGKEMDISYRKLAKYNERDKDDVLTDGDRVYLRKKRTRADKGFKKQPHTVRGGESMYDISQLYGIRLKSLYKKNNLSSDYMPRVGDKLKVY